MLLAVNASKNISEGYERGYLDGSTDNPESITFTQGRNENARKVKVSIPDGYKKTKFKSHGQSVYTNGKDFISPDKDGHNGGIWKRAKTLKDLENRETRMGTYDEFLNRIAD